MWWTRAQTGECSLLLRRCTTTPAPTTNTAEIADDGIAGCWSGSKATASCRRWRSCAAIRSTCSTRTPRTRVDYRFDTRISALAQTDDAVVVALTDGTTPAVDLAVGADGFAGVGAPDGVS